MWRDVLLYCMYEPAVPLPETTLFVRVCSACDVSLSYVGDFIAFRPGINAIRMYKIVSTLYAQSDNNGQRQIRIYRLSHAAESGIEQRLCTKTVTSNPIGIFWRLFRVPKSPKKFYYVEPRCDESIVFGHSTVLAWPSQRGAENRNIWSQWHWGQYIGFCFYSISAVHQKVIDQSNWSKHTDISRTASFMVSSVG